MSFKFRRSETIEQHEYEKQIHDEQLGAQSTTSTHGLASKLKSSKLEEDSENARKQKCCALRSLKDRIKASLPEAIQDVKIVKGLTALETRVKREIQDPAIFPEVQQVARVRRGLELCDQEISFLAKRKLHVRDAFAQYLGLNPDEIHPDDVPTVSFGGSGGGFRAMIGCLAYCDAFKQAGLWDCLTYVSGVSGSCWSLAAYYTFGLASMQNVLEHCKKRFSPYHPLSGDAIRSILSAPGGARTTLGPLIQKSQSGLHTVAMDLYSVFTTGWIFFQDDPASHPGGSAKKEVAGYQRSWYRYSSAQEYTDSGAEPLPIMTAIRHERPWKDWVDKEHPFKEPDHSAEEHEDAGAWFQWFEMTPYEIGCDEIEAWVPTWAFGRPFSEGNSTMQLPEQSLALLLGLCTSAPAGPLTSYIATVSRNLPPGFLGSSIHSLARGVTKFWGKQGTEEFQNHHPLHACNEHNFMYHFTPINKDKSSTRPAGLENSPRLHLIDSGMDNNCPTYVLLHPSRRADVIINMDASSDVQKDAFADRVNQIGNRRGLKFTKRQFSSDSSNPTGYAQIYDGLPIPRPDTVIDSYGKTVPNPPAPVYKPENGEVTMVYMPLLPNEKAVKDFDPSTAKFSGSYNLVWTAEQVQMLVDVCRANFEEGEGVVREVLWEAYLRRKKARQESE
jgi:phospholipase A2